MQIGIIEEQVRLVKKNDELIKSIIKKRGWSDDAYDKVRDMLRYNVLSVKQVSEIFGLDVSTVTNKLRPKLLKGEYITELDATYAFRTLDSLGPKFIVRNQKFDEQLKNYI